MKTRRRAFLMQRWFAIRSLRLFWSENSRPVPAIGGGAAQILFVGERRGERHGGDLTPNSIQFGV